MDIIVFSVLASFLTFCFTMAVQGHLKEKERKAECFKEALIFQIRNQVEVKVADKLVERSRELELRVSKLELELRSK